VRDERQRLAREIHDTITQGLIGIITQLEAARQTQSHAKSWQRHLTNAERLVRESLSEARRSVTASLPESLEGASLPEALSQVAQQWTMVNGVPIKVVVAGDAEPLHPEIEVAILRTAQEALANVARHAQASRVGLTLSYMGDVVALDVRDDGSGFVISDGRGSQQEGFGLTTMRQRVSRVAGTLIVESEPGVGTSVSARIPAIPAQQEVLV
jgi:signal transduction histidine kinase